jgi:hypothetical protein
MDQKIVPRLERPWMASCTNPWRLFATLGRHPEVVHKRLHKKYGDVVRMGSNFMSTTDLEKVKKIFFPNSGNVKLILLASQDRNTD